MRNLKDMMALELTACQLDATTKKQVLESISDLVNNADDSIKYQDILEALQKRERLGSTAIGYGVAIPHARVKNIKRALCALITLKAPVDFESAEEVHNQPVDLIFFFIGARRSGSRRIGCFI